MQAASLDKRFIAALIDGVIVVLIVSQVWEAASLAFPERFPKAKVVSTERTDLNRTVTKKGNSETVEIVFREKGYDAKGVLVQECDGSESSMAGTGTGVVKSSASTWRSCWGVPDQTAFQISSFLVVLLVYGILSDLTGGGIGKRIRKLRVVAPNGKAISIGRAAWRNLIKLPLLFGLIGYVAALFARDKRALHDRAAGTIVIDAKGDAGLSIPIP
jgi:uncharacterized RDD family membrane protein YckC